MNRMLVPALLLPLVLAACTWVKMEPVGARVQVLAASAATGHCESVGEIAVSVRDRVGFMHRNNLKVRDELETMARNEAGKLDADSIQPLEEPSMGEQRFAAYRCHGVTPRAAGQARPAALPEAQEPEGLQTEEVEVLPARLD